MAKLTFMVGGVKEEYNAAQELLTCMGANVVYCGQVGTGQVRMLAHTRKHTHTHEHTPDAICEFVQLQAAKICNNMLLAIGMIGTAETMNLGIR